MQRRARRSGPRGLEQVIEERHHHDVAGHLNHEDRVTRLPEALMGDDVGRRIRGVIVGNERSARVAPGEDARGDGEEADKTRRSWLWCAATSLRSAGSCHLLFSSVFRIRSSS